MIGINYDKLDKQVKINNTNYKLLSESIGMEKSYISSCKRSNRGMKQTTVIALAQALGCSVDDISGGMNGDPLEMSDFEIEVLDKLNKIMAEIEVLKSGKTKEANPDEPIESEEKKAENLLSKMLMSANGGAVTYDDYVNRLKVLSITEPKIISDAIAKCHCGITVRGYGNNKTKWIHKAKG